MEKKYKLLIGIDPGVSGAIASYLYDRQSMHCHSINVVNMPETIFQIRDYITYLVNDRPHTGYLIMIERVGLHFASAQDPARAMRLQRLIKSYNQMLGVFVANDFKFKEVEPTTWQTVIMTRKVTDYSKRKAHCKMMAGKFIQSVKPTLKNGDSICILEYLRRQYSLDKNLIQ